jgi:hypothetical protein
VKNILQPVAKRFFHSPEMCYRLTLRGWDYPLKSFTSLASQKNFLILHQLIREFFALNIPSTKNLV